MTVNYRTLCRELEQELLHESFRGKHEGEASTSQTLPLASTLRSLRFANDPDLQAVATGHLRLGRPNDSPYPAPIRSEGSAVRKVQQALLDLGHSLPRNGDDGRYGEETYQAVLAYKRQFNIRTASGYLDGIVGTNTMAHLDSRFPPGPLPACSVPYPPLANAEGEFASPPAGGALIPWMTCDPQAEPLADPPCANTLPDFGVASAENGQHPQPAQAPNGTNNYYCVKKSRVHIEIRAWWEEMLPREQRRPDERDRNPAAPSYTAQFKGYSESGLTPGVAYSRDLRVVPGSGKLMFLTSSQSNRIFNVQYNIRESD